MTGSFDIEAFASAYREAELAAALSVDPRVLQCASSPVFQDNGFPGRGIGRANLGYFLVNPRMRG